MENSLDKKVLLIIDVQKGLIDYGMYKSEIIIENIKKLKKKE